MALFLSGFSVRMPTLPKAFVVAGFLALHLMMLGTGLDWLL